MNRRSFLATLPALIAGIAIAKPEPEPLRWSTLETAAPLSQKSLQDAIRILEETPVRHTAQMRYLISFDNATRGFIYNTGA